MAQSVVDCCNSALQKLGAARIISIDDNSREGRACTQAFDSNRRDELRKHLWNFAIKRVVLAPDVSSDTPDYLYQFTLPTDCIRVTLPRDATLDWVVEGRKIRTNSILSPVGTSGTGPQLRLRYLADIEDVTVWDPSFYNVVSIALAMDMCEVLTNSPAKLDRLAANYKQAVSEARVADAFENLPAEAPDDAWWLARY